MVKAKAGAKRFLWEKAPGVWYVRRRGRYWRIKAAAGTPEFDVQYWAILKGNAPAPRTSWAALVERFRASDRWRDLKPRTRSDYEKCFAYILEKNGPKDVARMHSRDVAQMLDANAHRVRFGNYVQTVLSILCEFARELGWRDTNPALRVRKRKVPVDRRAPHEPWPDWAVERFRADAAPLPRLIFEIGIGTVQRPGDWPRFTWGDYDGARLTLTQGKTGVKLALPVTADLRAVLDRGERLGPGVPILRGPDGAAMKYRYLSAVMLAERKRLHLQAFDLHALRYRGVQELAWAGCDDDEISSYSGHASKAMVIKYAGEARQIMRARQAAAKRGGTDTAHK
jgi:hypothetical protein